MNNQEILRKHTALTVSRKDVNTSFIMFPVRLETRFVEGKRVDDISEPDRVLYAYKAIWNYVRSIPSVSSLPSQARHVLDAVENLDTVYREDKTRLLKICTAVASRTARGRDLKGMWDRVLVHLDRLATLDVVHDNEATEFLYQLEKVHRTLTRMRTKPRFSGASRFKKDSVYSQTAVFKNARKEMQACLPVLEQLLPDDPAQSIVNRFTLLTKSQFRKFQRVIALFTYSPASFVEPLNRVGILVHNRRKTLEQKEMIMKGFKKDLAQYEKYRNRYLGTRDQNGRPVPGRAQSLTDKMHSKVGEYCRYTRFAERMILWQLWLQTGRHNDIASAYLVGKWRKLADKTIFSFQEEREWLVSVLRVYNEYERGKNPFAVISPAHLNRHNRYIRSRKLGYRVKTKKSLLVRIYPDEVAVTQLSKPITQVEEEHGREFWLRYYAAQEDESKMKAAWLALCSLHTAPRATLIARSVFPDNPTRISKLQWTARQDADLINGGIPEKEKDRLFQCFGKKIGISSTEEEPFSVPMSEMMPDRFILQAKLDNGGKKDVTLVKYGRLIPKSIQVGLDLNKDDSVNVSDKGLRFKGNLRWMTDYDEAERMGMAITLPLDAFFWEHHALWQKREKKRQGKKVAEPRTFHFNSIYVMGMKEFDPDNAKDSDTCSQLLAKVMNAHLYSEDGFELLKIGTPTNILSDGDLSVQGTGNEAKSSDYDTSADVLAEEFYRKSIEPFLTGSSYAKPFSDVSRLSDLFCFNKLTVRENPFLNTLGWDNMEFRKAELVREAFLRVLKNSHPLLKLIYDSPRLREYFVDCVSPFGVYPPFRIGAQPYGIVPVCDFKNLRYGKKDPLQKMKELLLLLADKWNVIAETSVISEENMYRKDKLTTEQRYVKAVSATPISSSFYARANVREQDVLTPEYFKGWKDSVDPLGDVLRLLGSIDPSALAMADPVGTYLPSYANLPLRDAVFAEFKGDQSFTWGNLKVSIRNEVRKIEKEAKDWGDYIDPHGAGEQEPDDSMYKVFENVPDKEVDDLITATFDLFNYRLDAWLTGLLEHRIQQRTDRDQHSHKIALGAYGWVFNLHEDKAESASNEYIIAPSVNQAITAAVLRSSYNRAADGDKKDYSLSVNLSSARVRQALRIIHGIQNGLSLGAILGNDLERMLHDERNRSGSEMDFFIYYLRAAYPLNDTSTTYGPGEKEHSIDVLNGVALLEDLRGHVKDQAGSQKCQLAELYALSSENLKWWLLKIFRMNGLNEVKALFGQGENERFEVKIPRLILLVQEMEDSFDALSDVVTAESVYKLTEGNTAAVDALMNSLQNGRSIPVPDVTEIPVRSAHIEQRVIAALRPDLPTPDCDSYLQMAEPGVDRWMGEMLGFTCYSLDQYIPQWLGDEGLGISPSELVYLSGDWDKFENFLRLMSVCHSGKTVRGEGAIPLEEAKIAVDSMRELLSHARPLRQDDMLTEAVSPDPGMEVMTRCGERYALVSQKVHELCSQLNSQAEQIGKDFQSAPAMPLTESRLKKVLHLLLQCFRMGLLDALSGFDLSLFVPDGFRYEHPVEFANILSRHQQLPKRLSNLAGIIEERLLKAESLVKESVPDALKALLGSYLIVVPGFRIEGNKAIDSQSMLEQFSTAGYFRNAGRADLEDALMELAEVRRPLLALHILRLFGKFHYVEDYANGDVSSVRPLQLGYKSDREDDRHYWMGLEVPREDLVRDASVFTVLTSDQLFVRDKEGNLQDIAGLVFDFWVDKIPYRSQTAGVVFGYDQPDAEPPQAVLVGVSTIGGKHMWSERRMIRTIRSAMHQIKSRAVEPEHVYADKWTSALFPLLSIDPDNPTK